MCRRQRRYTMSSTRFPDTTLFRSHCRHGVDASRRRCPLGDRTGVRGQQRARALMALMTEKLRAIMALDPDRIELDFEGRDYSWRQIADAVRAIEDTLGAMGLPEDARIVVMLRNRPGNIAAPVAVRSTSPCLVTLTPPLPQHQLFSIGHAT